MLRAPTTGGPLRAPVALYVLETACCTPPGSPAFASAFVVAALLLDEGLNKNVPALTSGHMFDVVLLLEQDFTIGKKRWAKIHERLKKRKEKKGERERERERETERDRVRETERNIETERERERERERDRQTDRDRQRQTERQAQRDRDRDRDRDRQREYAIRPRYGELLLLLAEGSTTSKSIVAPARVL